MIVSTTTAIDGRPVSEYVGVVTGEAVLGANVFRDLFAGLRDIVGGRSAGYERSLRQARETAIGEMVAEAEQLGADAVVGVDVDYESIQIGQGGSMLMVSASGTAVKLSRLSGGFTTESSCPSFPSACTVKGRSSLRSGAERGCFPFAPTLQTTICLQRPAHALSVSCQQRAKSCRSRRRSRPRRLCPQGRCA